MQEKAQQGGFRCPVLFQVSIIKNHRLREEQSHGKNAALFSCFVYQYFYQNQSIINNRF